MAVFRDCLSRCVMLLTLAACACLTSAERLQSECDGQVRCCHASAKGEDGFVQTLCRDYTGDELEGSCTCPRVELAGQQIQSHFCGEKKGCNKPHVPGNVDYDSQPFKSCTEAMPKLVEHMQLAPLFGVGAGKKTMIMNEAEDYWKDVSSSDVFEETTGFLEEIEQAASMLKLRFADIMSMETYRFERERLESYRLVNVTGSIISASAVQSICSMSVGSIWQLLQSHRVGSAVNELCGLDHHNQYPKWLIRDAIMSLCFQSCTDAMQQAVDHEDEFSSLCNFANNSPETIQKLARRQQCVDLPTDTKVFLVEWVMRRKCWVWDPPSPIWSPKDKGISPPPMNPEDAPTLFHPVCTALDGGVTAMHGPQFGVCPEGTACRCPSNEVFKEKTIQEIRMGVSGSVFEQLTQGGVIQGANMVASSVMGEFGYPLLVAQSAKSVSQKNWAELGAIVTGAIGSAVAGKVATGIGVSMVPALLVAALPVYVLKRAVYASLKDCIHTLGCWPAQPVLLDGFCVLPESAKQGGSPVWFLPPSGTLFQRTSGYMDDGCEIAACSPDELAQQEVGFHGARALNCQPLSWKNMDTVQQKKLASAFQHSCSADNSGNCNAGRETQVAILLQQAN